MPRRKGSKNVTQKSKEVFDNLPVQKVLDSMTPSQFRAFKVWESLPPASRNYVVVAREAEVTKATVAAWDKTFNFNRLAQSREMALYKEADALEKPKVVDKIVKLRGHYESFLDKLWEKIEEMPELLEIKTVKDISTLVNDYIKLRGLLTPEEKTQDPDNVVNNVAMFLGAGASTEQIDRLLNVLETAMIGNGGKDASPGQKQDSERYSDILDMDRSLIVDRLNRVSSNLTPESLAKNGKKNLKSGDSSTFLPENFENTPEFESEGLVLEAELV